ncbi:tRNA (uracil(54)-C(5))-methyltransferase homolog-B-like [Argonauta hians]
MFPVKLRPLCLSTLGRVSQSLTSTTTTSALTQPTQETPPDVNRKKKMKKMRILMNHPYSNSDAQFRNCTVSNQYRQIALSVTPLYDMPYKDQLEFKNYNMRAVLHRTLNRFVRTEKYPLSDSIVDNINNFLRICPLEPCLPSPVVNGYRYKDNTIFGKGVDSNPRTVGLTVGKGLRSYVVPNTYLLNVCDKHKEISRAFQDFLMSSSIDCFKLETWADDPERIMASGHWRNMTIRSSTLGQSMAYIVFHPQREPQDLQLKAKEELLNYFQHGPGRLSGLDTLFFQPSFSPRINANYVPFQLLYGEPYITERLMDKMFRISIDSFFQINVSAAEVLYSTIKDCAKLQPSDVILDICCGTGSIGIFLAPHAKRLFGVEIVQQAIDDAKINAQLNNVTNAEFICSRASMALKAISVGSYFGVDETAVAVVNPSRNGVSQSVIRSIRRCRQIRRLVYVTCRPIGNTIRNFVELCCPPSEKLPGKPFSPVRAVPVDMFPHTVHCELIMVFER